jgi:hypothetical protein
MQSGESWGLDEAGGGADMGGPGRTPVSEPSYQRSADHFAFGATAELLIHVIEIDQGRRRPGFNAKILAITPISDHAEPGRLAEGLIHER